MHSHFRLNERDVVKRFLNILSVPESSREEKDLGLLWGAKICSLNLRELVENYEVECFEL